MDEAVQQGTAVVTEGGTAVRVDLELVLASGVLCKTKREMGSSGYQEDGLTVISERTAEVVCL